MKNATIHVEFKKPEKILQEQLQRSGARNIYIRRNFSGELEIRYSIKVDANAEFKKLEDSLKQQLQRSGARNIYIRKNFSSEMEVRYTIKADDPEKEIGRVILQCGAKDVRASSTFSGARFDYKLEDIIDEREFKRRLQDLLRKSGYRSN